MALTCVEVDRHKRPTIGNILNKLYETENASQFPDALLKDPGSTKNQVRSLTAQLCFTMIIFPPRNIWPMGYGHTIYMFNPGILYSEKNNYREERLQHWEYMCLKD